MSRPIAIDGTPPSELVAVVVALQRVQTCAEFEADCTFPFLSRVWARGTRVLHDGRYRLVTGVPATRSEPAVTILEVGANISLVSGPWSATSIEDGALPTAAYRGTVVHPVPPEVSMVSVHFPDGDVHVATVREGVWSTHRSPPADPVPDAVVWHTDLPPMSDKRNG